MKIGTTISKNYISDFSHSLRKEPLVKLVKTQVVTLLNYPTRDYLHLQPTVIVCEGCLAIGYSTCHKKEINK